MYIDETWLDAVMTISTSSPLYICCTTAIVQRQQITSLLR